MSLSTEVEALEKEVQSLKEENERLKSLSCFVELHAEHPVLSFDTIQYYPGPTTFRLRLVHKGLGVEIKDIKEYTVYKDAPEEWGLTRPLTTVSETY